MNIVHLSFVKIADAWKASGNIRQNDNSKSVFNRYLPQAVGQSLLDRLIDDCVSHDPKHWRKVIYHSTLTIYIIRSCPKYRNSGLDSRFWVMIYWIALDSVLLHYSNPRPTLNSASNLHSRVMYTRHVLTSNSNLSRLSNTHSVNWIGKWTKFMVELRKISFFIQWRLTF